MIELMIMCGVIAILMSITIPTVKAIVTQSKVSDAVTLQAANAMLRNFQSGYGVNAAAATTAITAMCPNVAVTPPPDGSDRTCSAVTTTRHVMKLLLANKASSDALKNLPSNVVWDDLSGQWARPS